MTMTEIYSMNNDDGSKCIQGTMHMTANVFNEKWVWQQMYWRSDAKWVWQQIKWRSDDHKSKCIQRTEYESKCIEGADHDRKSIQWIMNKTANVLNAKWTWQKTNLRNNDQKSVFKEQWLWQQMNSWNNDHGRACIQWPRQQMYAMKNGHRCKSIQWAITMAENVFKEQCIR